MISPNVSKLLPNYTASHSRIFFHENPCVTDPEKQNSGELQFLATSSPWHFHPDVPEKL
jgi:hypothetical protein